MSWSKKILFLYLGFVGLILTLVFTCFGHKTELEYKDYYAKELHFQDQINAERNSNNLSVPIKYQVTGRSVEIIYPAELLRGISGTIHLLRPSDSSKDMYLPVEPGKEGHQMVMGEKLERGHYKLRINVTSAGLNYYKEASIEFE